MIGWVVGWRSGNTCEGGVDVVCVFYGGGGMCCGVVYILRRIRSLRRRDEAVGGRRALVVQREASERGGWEPEVGALCGG